MKVIFDIKSVVDERGTQREFAELTGLHENVVGRLYHGVIGIHLKTLAKIMEATGLTPNDLFIIEAE